MPPIDVSSDGSRSEDEIPARKAPKPTPRITELDDDAMSDDGGEVIPTKEKSPKLAPEPMDEDDDADEKEEGGEGEEEYIVEKILNHQFDLDGVCRYLVKWKGYEKKSDMTWEPSEHLEEGASDVLAEYHNSIGGKPVRKAAGAKRSREGTSKTPQSGNKGKSRKVNDSASATPTVTETRVGKWKPPTGSWEEEIQAIDTVESDERGLHVYVQWNSGKKSRHPIEEIYKKCPQKMLHFYEQHLVFREGEGKASSSNGD